MREERGVWGERLRQETCPAPRVTASSPGGGLGTRRGHHKRRVVRLGEQWPPGPADVQNCVGKKVSGRSTHADHSVSCLWRASVVPANSTWALPRWLSSRQLAYQLLCPSFQMGTSTHREVSEFPKPPNRLDLNPSK